MYKNDWASGPMRENRDAMHVYARDQWARRRGLLMDRGEKKISYLVFTRLSKRGRKRFRSRISYGARIVTNMANFPHGNTGYRAKPFQELRGLFAHYADFNRIWKIMDQPIDALFAYPDPTSLWVRCDDNGIWADLRHMVSSIRGIGSDRIGRNILFSGSLSDVVADEKR